MDRIGIRELRQNASVYLDRVKDGESFEITERGVPIAMISPVGAMSVIDRMIADGTITPGRGDLGAWLRDNPPTGPGGLSETLQRMRDEEYE